MPDRNPTGGYRIAPRIFLFLDSEYPEVPPLNLTYIILKFFKKPISF
jgi:hypothetical protein